MWSKKERITVGSEFSLPFLGAFQEFFVVSRDNFLSQTRNYKKKMKVVRILVRDGLQLIE